MSDKYFSSAVCTEESDFIRKWADLLDGKKEIPPSDRYNDTVPFSFMCGKRNSRDWLNLKDARRKRGDWQNGKRVNVLTWTDKETSVRCEMELTEFSDFPVLEWVLKLTNCGDKETEPISNFKALDIFWKRNDSDKTTPELRRSLGSDARIDDFKYACDELRRDMWTAKRTIRMDSSSNNALRTVRDGNNLSDGRPSATWLPFFNLRTGPDGIIIALGWSGQWFAEFAHDGEGTTTVSAGMEHLEAKLKPGESLRSPRILVQYWSGTPMHGQNIFRKFILATHVPRSKGKPVRTPTCCGTWGGTPTQGHFDLIEKIKEHKLPYDYYWIDAGWYGTCEEPCPNVFNGKWWIVGDWRVNRNYHPNGLKPISDAVHNAGMKFLLWIEPERALYGTPVTLEHPNWFLRKKDGPMDENEMLLLNMGNPEAWRWAVDTVSGLISENGIDCFREDFNLDPSPFWVFADIDGRKGITEMRYVEGFYSFWDELLRRHPGLLIDNCASGGRRIDLETISRSVALWRTDYNCFPFMSPEASQVHGFGLSHWLPSNAISPCAKPGDTYQFRSALSAGIVFNIDEFGLNDYKHNDYPWDWHMKMILDAKRASPYFYGDFIPLTQCDCSPDSWMASQFHIPGKNEGMILVFRHSESSMSTGVFCLRELSRGKTYEFEDADSGKTWRATGSELMTEGLVISADTPRTSRLLFYRKT
ncbi:MAG: glycoside hydrolase family 36 protein [Victivallales bacterium]